MPETIPLPGPAVLGRLTADAHKAALFAEDSFFREGWSDIQALQPEPVERIVHPVALALFKPEALAAGKVAPALDWLAERGFAPAAFEVIPFTGPTIHGLWRYQIRRNTIDKIRLYTRWIAQFPAMVVALRHDGLTGSAAERLSALKGPALVAKRSPADLRSHLGSPNSILNFLHSADEPADVVREIAILVPAPKRRAFITALAAESPEPGIAVDLRLAAHVSRPHSVDPKSAGRAIADKLRKAGGARAAAAITTIENVLAGRLTLDLYAFEEACVDLSEEIDPVDMFVFGSEFIERDIVGLVGELDKRSATM